MSSNTKTLEVITVEASPVGKGGYKGQFILPLTYDVNIVNELTSRMNGAGPSGELLEFDEFIFIDLSTSKKYIARDLWLTEQRTQNHFVYEKDGIEAVGGRQQSKLMPSGQ